MTFNLWNESLNNENYSNTEYQKHILEQYIFYAETADRVTERRNQMNAFFISINTLIITGIGLFYDPSLRLINKAIIVIPLIAVLSLCVLWWFLLISYRRLNIAKYKIITEEYETKLPSMPFLAEWILCKEIKRPELTIIELFVPPIFGSIYLVGAVLLIFS